MAKTGKMGAKAQREFDTYMGTASAGQKAELRAIAGGMPATSAKPLPAMAGGAPAAVPERIPYGAGRPPGESVERMLARRYDGGTRLELGTVDQQVDDLYSLAKRLKVPLRPGERGRTALTERLSEAWEYPGSLDEAARALGLSDAEKQLIAELRAASEAETQRMLRDVPNFKPLEFYAPHEFKTTARPRGWGWRGRPVGVKPGFTRQRRLEGTAVEKVDRRLAEYEEAVATGREPPELLDLYTWDPIERLQRRIYRGVLYRNQQVLLNEMKRMNLAKRVSEIAPEERELWRVPENIPPFRPKILASGGATEPWAVPLEIAKALDDQFAISAFTTNAPLKLLRQSIATLKFAKTFGGLFQHVDYTLRMFALSAKYQDPSYVGAAIKAFARGYLPGLHKRILRWELTSQDHNAVIRRGLIDHGLNAEAGLGFVGPEFESLARELAIWRVPHVGKALRAFGSGTYRNAHREYLLSSGTKIVQNRVEGGMGMQAALAKTALDMNEIFSSLPAWQSVFRNPTTRDVMRTTLFSFLEQESWVRIPIRQKGLFLAIIGNTVAYANLINMVTTGKPLSPGQYNPVTKAEPGALWPIGYNTAFLRPELPWKGPAGRLQYLDLLGQADTPMRIALDPSFAAKTRLSQILGIGIPLASAALTGEGRTIFRGKPIKTAGDVGGFLLEQVSPIPAAGLFEERQRIGWPGALVQAVGLNISAEGLGQLRTRVAKQENPNNSDVQANGFRGLTPAEVRDFYFNHPELEEAGEQAVRNAAERGDEWALYRQDVDQAYQGFVSFLARAKDASPEEQRQVYNTARDILGAQLATIDARYADLVAKNEERRERDGPANDTEKLLAERNAIYDEFEDPATGAVPLDRKEAFYQALDVWEAGLSGKEQAALDENTGLREVPAWVKQYRRDQKALRNYWNRSEAVWAEMREMYAALNSYETPQAYRQKVEADIVKRGLVGLMAPESDPFLGLYNTAVARTRRAYRLENPSINAILTYWYGNKALTWEAHEIAQEMTEETVAVR